MAALPLRSPGLEDNDREHEETDNEKLVNFVRLCLIILEAVPCFLRGRFRALISVKTKQSTLKKDWEDGEECGKWLEKEVKRSVEGWVKKKIKMGEVSEWDLSTLAKLLLFSNQSLLDRTSSSWKAVDKLRDRRNQLVGHSNSARTESHLLEEVVDDAKDLYESFKGSVDDGVIASAKEEIDKLRSETFVDGNLAAEMKKLLSTFQSYEDQLKAFVQDSDGKHEAHQKELEEVQALIIVLQSELEGRLKTVEADVVDLKERQGNMETDMVDMKETVKAIEERQGATDEKVGAMAANLERLKEMEQKRLDCDSVPDSQGNGSTNGNHSENDFDGTVSQKKDIIALEELDEDLMELPAQWYNLGIHLKVDIGKLDEIQADINKQVSKVDHCFPEVLKAWKTNPKNFTKEKLVKALRTIGEKGLAGRIEKNAEFKMDIPSLMVSLKGCKAKYFNLGIHLGVEFDQIKGFESYGGDSARCLSTMLREYVSNVSPNVEEVCQAVKQIGRTDIALKLEEKYKGRHFREE